MRLSKKEISGTLKGNQGIHIEFKINVLLGLQIFFFMKGFNSNLTKM